MIFGFNTDIKHEDTIYHVQSEAREHEHLLQTQIFVRGRCIGKHAQSYGDHLQQPGFSDASMHELLKAQHRSALDAIRAGKLDIFLASPDPLASGESVQAPALTPEAVTDAGSESNGHATPEMLSLELLGSSELRSDGNFVLRMRLVDSGSKIPGARLISKATCESLAQPLYSQVLTDDDGIGELRITPTQKSSEMTVLIQCTHKGRTATRKLVLRSNQTR